MRIPVGAVTPEYKAIRGRVHLVSDLYSVPYDHLYKIGVRRIIFDYDKTLCSMNSTQPAKEVIDLIMKLKERFVILIFSNNFLLRKKRAAFFKEKNIVYVRTQKPFFFEHIKVREPLPTIIVGDKVLTDGLYAIFQHIPAYLIRRSWFRR